MRSFLAWLLALLAVLLLPAAVVSGWTKTVLLDTDRYVATVAPLADDPVVQEAAQRRLEDAAFTTVERRLGVPMPDSAREVVGSVTSTVVESHEFAAAWRSANRSAHREAVAVLEGRARPATRRDGRVDLEVGPMLTTVMQTLVSQGLLPENQVPEIPVSLPLLRSSDLVQAREAFDLLDAAGFWLPVLCAGLAVFALIIAPRRRGVLGWLGYGSVVTLLATLAGLLLVRDVVLDRAFHADAELLEAVWDVVTRALFELLGVMLLAALGLLVIRWLAGLRSREAG